LAARPRALVSADSPSISGGSIAGFNFRLEGRTRLTFRIGSQELWSHLHLTLEELARLLTGLAGAWDALGAEESYPLSVSVDAPSQLKTALRPLMPGSSELELAVEEYRTSHDLAAWLGVETPSLWFMREGLLMVIESSGITRRVDAAQALWTLERFGDALSRVVKQDYPAAWAAWHHRNTSDGQSIERLVRMSLGGSDERAQDLFDRKIIMLPTRRSDAMRGLDEVLAAARMWPVSVPIDDLARAATEIRATPHQATPELDQLSIEALAMLEEGNDKPVRETAIVVAQWLRRRLGLSYYDRIEPKQILDSWDVLIRRMELVPDVDAVSFWGDRHGPCILLNPNSLKASTGSLDQDGLTAAMRFTLAHEMCHLLLDRKGSLPVAEVLGGATPVRSETRSDVFASHLLLPFEAVEQEHARSYSLEVCVGNLMVSFGVSRMLAAAQLLWRYYHTLPSADREWLRAVVSGQA
jgi:hypothetical protein